MKYINLTILSTLTVAMLSSCGTDNMDSKVIKSPHDTSKLSREVSDVEDWTWDVGFTVSDNGDSIALEGKFWAGLPDEVEHIQYFIDIDNDVNSGFTASSTWEIDGADYLIEDKNIYKSISNTEFLWEHVGTLDSVENSHMELSKDNSLTEIFNSGKSFKVMIEVFDKDWIGNYTTVVGIDAEVYEKDDDNVGEYKTKEVITSSHRTDTAGIKYADVNFVYTFNKYGQLISKLSDKDENVGYIYTYKDGYLSKKESRTTGDIWRYYKTGEVKVVFWKASKRSIRYRYEYDDEGKLITRVETTLRGGDYFYEFRYESLENYSVYKRAKNDGEEDSLYLSHTDDKESYYSLDGKVTGTTLFTRDDKGRVIKQVMHWENGSDRVKTDTFTFGEIEYLIK